MATVKLDAEQEPDYDHVDPDYDQEADRDYEENSQYSEDEGAQPDYDTDFADPDAQEASQEYAKRSQK